MDPVLIAGAGPVGCTLALFLAQNDIPIILVEAEKTIPMDLRASTFHPPTLDMLARLGLVKDMLTVGLKVNDYQYRCLLYTSPSPRDLSTSRMPSSA